jgi:hypothetical protein
MVVDGMVKQSRELGVRSSQSGTVTISRSIRVRVPFDEEICFVLRLKHVFLELRLACNLGRDMSVLGM